MRISSALLFLLAVSAVPVSSTAVSRFEALTRARTYAQHPWRCGQSNLTAACAAGYKSVYQEGDYVGLPYDWGGYVTLGEFDQSIESGLGAGSYSDDGVLACTVGLDCSGFVSRVWNTGHYSTSSLHNVSHEIDASKVLPADAFNIAGYHVRLFETQQANGDPRLIEASGYNVHVTFWDSWTSLDGYTPIRYDAITDDASAFPDGTADNPVLVGSFPFVQERDTSLSVSDMFDVCLGAAPGKGEYGPEVIYRLDLMQPGTVTVAVQDDADTDVDVHLYSALNETDCFARDDKLVSASVDCGTLYVIADSYTSAGTGVDYPGVYTITIDFEPVDQACGAGPPPYSPGGAPGEPCGYPSDTALPFCNPNLGGVACLYTSGPGPVSFCTYPCQSDAECQGDFAGGCCEHVDDDMGNACMPSEFCTAPPHDGGGIDQGLSETIGLDVFADPGPSSPETILDDDLPGEVPDGPDASAETGYDPGFNTLPDSGGHEPFSHPVSSGCMASSRPDSPWAAVIILAGLLVAVFRFRIGA